jgi:hypothetical protein
VEIKMEVPRDLAEKLQKLKGQNGWEDLMKEFLKLREEKLATELKEIEQKETKKNEPHKAKSRPTPTKIKKYVLRKTNHTCAFPGCTKPAENLHHTERFGITGRHNPEKIVPLCETHHKLVHTGLVDEENWKILTEPDQTDYKSIIDQRIEYYRQKATS